MPAVVSKLKPAVASAVPTPSQPVRDAVKEVLLQSKAFAQLPKDRQMQVARDTALVADYLAAPEGIAGNRLKGGVGMPTARALDDPAPPPPQESYDQARKAVSEIGQDTFKAGAAREGAEVAGLFMKKVNFVDFVGGLIKGVFNAIVTSSIQQMEAYSKMIEQVAKSLQQFRDDNVTDNQGRDQMVDRFPDVFEIDHGGGDGFSDSGGPRLKLKDGVDEDAALKRVQSGFKMEGGDLKSVDCSDEEVEQMLVDAARMQLAKQRQQLLASLVLMGINRIVVTDGRITAKIMYDFQARDNRNLKRSAVAYDYARDTSGNLAMTYAGEGEYDNSYTDKTSESGDRDAEYYAKGKYKYSDQPVMSAMSTATEASDSQLQTRAQLTGAVEVNFKSDYLPLEKMATPGMIAAIQGNSTPVDPNVVPSPRSSGTTTPAAAGTTATPAASTAPAAATTPAPAGA